MAIRIDASGDYVRRTTSLPDDTLFTIMGWAYLVSDRTGNYRYFATVENATSSSTNYKIIGFRSDNSFGVDTPTDSGSFASAPSDGAWFYFALVCNGTGGNTLTGYYITAAGTVATCQADSTAMTEAALYLGNDSYDEWNNIRLANIIVYDAALTQAEIVAQMRQLIPVRRTNIHAWWPMFGGSSERLADYSGNGRTLTEGGTLSDEAGPPVAWGMSASPMFVVSAGGTTYPQTVSGALSPAGAIIKEPHKALSGAISPAGALIKEAHKTLSGTISPTGALVKEAHKGLAGAITPTGALSALRTAHATLTGAISPAGSLTSLRKAYAVLAGAISPAGVLIKEAHKVLVGSIGPTGTLIKETHKVLAGAITLDGTLIKEAHKILSGTISPGGTLTTVRTAYATLTGAISPVGGLVKKTLKILAGAIAPAGSLTAVKSGAFLVSLAGAIAPTGAIIKETHKVLAGSIGPAGAMVKEAHKILSGAISPAGGLAGLRTAYAALAGAIAPVGALVKKEKKTYLGPLRRRQRWLNKRPGFWPEPLALAGRLPV